MELNWYEVTTTLIIMALLVLWFRAGTFAGKMMEENDKMRMDLSVALGFEEMYRKERHKEHGAEAEEAFKKFTYQTASIIKEKNGIVIAGMHWKKSGKSAPEASDDTPKCSHPEEEPSNA